MEKKTNNCFVILLFSFYAYYVTNKLFLSIFLFFFLTRPEDNDPGDRIAKLLETPTTKLAVAG